MGKYINLRANIALGLAFTFLLNTLGPIPVTQAGEFSLPVPGVRVALSPEYNPPILKGLKVHPDNPFRFDFILDVGDGSKPSQNGRVLNQPLQQDATRLIKYFLASLTIPEKDLWVNLSPYEKNRIVPASFGQTEMGRDLLAEDYMLKQITASLIYPEGETGKKFWKRIYEEAYKKFGTTNIPVNTFNKVWIVPEKAVVYENAKAGTAYVVESKLKVMLEQDYLSLEKHTVIPPLFYKEGVRGSSKDVSSIGSQIIREIVIPELTREVNEGKNFAQLRQVYNSLILATWYKNKIKDSILEQVYADKNKVKGIEALVSLRGAEGDVAISKKNDVEFIYQQYLQAFKKGVYNYIKEEPDTVTGITIPRKYFSGGFSFAGHISAAMTVEDREINYTQVSQRHLSRVSAQIEETINALASQKNSVAAKDRAMLGIGEASIAVFFSLISYLLLLHKAKGDAVMDLDVPGYNMFHTSDTKLVQSIKELKTNPFTNAFAVVRLLDLFHDYDSMEIKKYVTDTLVGLGKRSRNFRGLITQEMLSVIDPVPFSRWEFKRQHMTENDLSVLMRRRVITKYDIERAGLNWDEFVDSIFQGTRLLGTSELAENENFINLEIYLSKYQRMPENFRTVEHLLDRPHWDISPAYTDFRNQLPFVSWLSQLLKSPVLENWLRERGEQVPDNADPYQMRLAFQAAFPDCVPKMAVVLDRPSSIKEALYILAKMDAVEALLNALEDLKHIDNRKDLRIRIIKYLNSFRRNPTQWQRISAVLDRITSDNNENKDVQSVIREEANKPILRIDDLYKTGDGAQLALKKDPAMRAHPQGETIGLRAVPEALDVQGVVEKFRKKLRINRYLDPFNDYHVWGQVNIPTMNQFIKAMNRSVNPLIDNRQTDYAYNLLLIAVYHNRVTIWRRWLKAALEEAAHNGRSGVQARDLNRENVVMPRAVSLPDRIPLRDDFYLKVMERTLDEIKNGLAIKIGYFKQGHDGPIGFLGLGWDERTFSWFPAVPVGHRINDEFRGQGLGREACSKLIDYLGVMRSVDIIPTVTSAFAQQMWVGSGAKVEYIGVAHPEQKWNQLTGYAYIIRKMRDNAQLASDKAMHSYNEEEVSKDLRTPADIFISNPEVSRKYPALNKAEVLVQQTNLSTIWHDTNGMSKGEINSLLSNAASEGVVPLWFPMMVHFSEYAYTESLYAADAQMFLWKMGQIAADDLMSWLDEQGALNFKLPLDHFIPRESIVKTLPILDVATGARGAYFMKQYRNDPIILVDNSFFVEAFLNRAKKNLGIGGNVVVRRVDIRDINEVFKEKQYQYIRLGNVDNYVDNIPNEFFEIIKEKVAPGGGFSIEYKKGESFGQASLAKLNRMFAADKNWEAISGEREGLLDEDIEYTYFKKKDSAQLVRKSDEDMVLKNLMSKSSKTGGIDLTPANMNVEVKTGSPTKTFGDDKVGIKFHLDPAMLQQLQNAPGFIPVIINIQPMTNLKEFLEGATF